MKMVVKVIPRTSYRPNRTKSDEIGPAAKSQKTACNSFVVQDKTFTTAELAVPGVEVIAEPKGKAFAGPYYLDQLELLRDTLRGMPKRERYEVATGETGFWIYRKPEAAK